MEERLTVRIGANLSEFERKMSKMQSKIDSVSQKMSAVGKGMTAGLTIPVAGAVAASIKSFADLEQAVGGVETLFKGSADAVIRNSETAYKRAGVSGVDYMENVTSFSATLLQGLGGDTEAAAKAADMAMVDMSDNANKFGTNIGSVQDAYQGFAKDNYTMLDNLKLGYGGTAGEMARLINESGVLGDAMEVTAETVNDVPFHTMVEAIHEVQTEMDVTGTTMKEAEETVSGSFGMMKASFQDLAAGFGQEGADIESLFENLTDSVGTFADNIKRVLGDMWDNLPIAGWKKWLGAIVVATGPVLMVLGKMIPAVMGVVGVMGTIGDGVAKAGGVFKYLGVVLSPIMKFFAMFKPLLAALTGPIGLTVAGIAALGAGFVLAYKKSETFRNFVDGIKEKFLTAIEWIGQFKDGIIGLFQDDGMAGIDILTSIGLSQEMADKLWEITGYFIEFYHKVKGWMDSAKTAITEAFAAVGAWWDSNGPTIIGAITNAFEKTKEVLTEVFNTVKDAFSTAFNAIKEWWDSNGESVIGGIVTAFEWMKETLGLVFDLVVATVKFAFKVIQGVFETFAPIVTGIWNLLWDTIKGTIEILAPIISGIVRTAIDIIVEAFNYFAPIVMGIWNTVWPAIQLTLTNVWEIIKSVVSIGLDFIQSIIRTATAIMEGDWSTVWEEIKGFTSRTFETIKELFSGMTKRATDLIMGMVDSVKQWFVDMYENLKQRAEFIKTVVVYAFTQLKDRAIEKITEMYNSITTWFSDLWSSIKTTVTNLKDDVVGFFVDMKDGAIEGVQKLYDGASDLFDDVKTYASDTFEDMVEGAKALPGKIGSAIKNMAHKAVEGITSLGRSMGDKMESVVNSVIGGLNKVLKAIGVGEIDPITINAGGGTATGSAGYVKKYSTGTRNGAIASDTLGMVNDRGPGNGRGGATQELIQRDGQLFAPRGKNAIVPLKKGDRIFNGAETQSLMSAGVIPRFSQGTGAEGGNSGQKKGFFGTLKDVVSNVWDYITNPGKAFEAIISSVSSNFDGFDGFAGKMLSGGFKMVTDGIKNFIAKIFKENEGALGSGKGGKWMNYRMTTPYSPNRAVPGYPTSFNGGRHYGIDYGTPIGTPITATTGGRLSSFWNEGGGKIAKLVTGQLRQFFMHMQTVAPNGSVKAGDVIGRSGNSGRWTTGPHVHWQAQQGTDSLNRNTIDPRRVIGHANGGIFSNQHIANFAEEGPEAIIPLSAKRRGRANSLYDSVGKAIGRDDGQQFRTMIDNQQKQIERMDKTINVLLGIEDKTGFDPGKAKKSIDRHVDDRAIIY